MQTTRTVFFDESGYTGQNLSDPTQPYFVYAGVIVEPDDAAERLRGWIEKYDVPRGINGEVKASSLITSRLQSRRDAIGEIVRGLAPDAWVAVFEKQFSLAAKFFDYTLDPILLPKIGFFHAIRFPQYLANLVALFARRDGAVEQLLNDFAALVRRGDGAFAETLRLVGDEPRDPIDCIRIILANQSDVILEHVDYSKQLPFGKWLLDLTTTGLFTLLMQIGRETLLRVICDESKPLSSDTSVFDALVGRHDDDVNYDINGMRLGSINLVEPISRRASHTEAGLQLADIVAGATAHHVKVVAEGGTPPFGDALDEINSVWVRPDMTEIDLHRREPQAKLLLLQALADRSIAGENLLDGIENLFEVMNEPQFAFKMQRQGSSD